jgi:hypothetical protein
MGNWCINNVEISHEDPVMIDRVVAAADGQDTRHLLWEFEQNGPRPAGVEEHIRCHVERLDDVHRVRVEFMTKYEPATDFLDRMVTLGFSMVGDLSDECSMYEDRYENGVTDEYCPREIENVLGRLEYDLERAAERRHVANSLPDGAAAELLQRLASTIHEADWSTSRAYAECVLEHFNRFDVYGTTDAVLRTVGVTYWPKSGEELIIDLTRILHERAAAEPSKADEPEESEPREEESEEFFKQLSERKQISPSV